MNLKQKIVYFLTRTPLHAGAGSALGPVDLPIQRESHTGFPVIPGSGIKGALAAQPHYFKKNPDGSFQRNGDPTNTCTRTQEARELFGDERTSEEGRKAGGISFSEAKLLAFPVRSVLGCFAWTVSPLTLRRWGAATAKEFPIPKLAAGQGCYDQSTLGETAVLEDYPVKHFQIFPDDYKLHQTIGVDMWQAHAGDHLALIPDDLFTHFARYACEIAPHVRIDPESGTVAKGALFSQENVPADTLFYAVFTEVRPGAFAKLKLPPVLQIGGDATTGLGYCALEAQDLNGSSGEGGENS